MKNLDIIERDRYTFAMDLIVEYLCVKVLSVKLDNLVKDSITRGKTLGKNIITLNNIVNAKINSIIGKNNLVKC